MTEDRAFLSAILASPTDRTLKLVYADWLDEHNDPRGEFLRVQCALEELPAHTEQHHALEVRVGELRVLCPANWVAALSGPVWCVVANALIERPYGPGGAEIRRGTKHFAPGSKVYVFDFHWGMGGEQVIVVGRHRKSKKFITLTMSAAHLANWRAELVYAPAVIRRIVEHGGEFQLFPRGSDESQKRAEDIAAGYNQRGGVSQPFITRQPRAEPLSGPTDLNKNEEPGSG